MAFKKIKYITKSGTRRSDNKKKTVEGCELFHFEIIFLPLMPSLEKNWGLLNDLSMTYLVHQEAGVA